MLFFILFWNKIKDMNNKNEIAVIINSVLVKSDPMKLISMGAPKNEYEIEAKMIADILIKNDSMICSPKIIHDVLLEQFDEEFTYDDCSNISKEITRALSQR